MHVRRGVSEWAGNKPCEKLGKQPGGKLGEKPGGKLCEKLGEKLGGFVGGFSVLQKCNSAAEGLTKKIHKRIHWKIHLGNQGRISRTNPTNEMAYNSIPGVGLQPKPGARARSLP